jgi:hypothetical protein
MGHIADSIDVLHPGNLQIITNLEPSEVVPVPRDLCGQSVGTQALSDNHRRRIDPLTPIEHHTTCIEAGDATSETLFNACIGQRRIDDRTRIVAEFRPK